uniref:SFRICE_035833 n=1 Tax=Spodoptera frugiperda TaxID=7108 RepID=A0A2H1VSK1_SPOFR
MEAYSNCSSYLRRPDLTKEKKNEHVPMCLYSDNQSSIKLATNPLFSNRRTKHIEARHHFVRECVSQNKVVIKYVSTSDMPRK